MSVPSLNILRLWNMNNRRKVGLKSVNSLLKKCLVEFAEKCVLEHQKRTIYKPKMSGTQGWILTYFIILPIYLTLCV